MPRPATKLLRVGARISSRLGSAFRIRLLRARYPALEVAGHCVIPRGCLIVCTDGSSMVLDRVDLGRGVVLIADNGGHLEISRSSVGPYSHVVAHERVTIGPGCALAEMVVVRDQDHVLDDATALTDVRMATAPVAIGTDTWLGAKATVLKGTTIGAKVVVGAGAVVTRSVPDGQRVAGVPARPLPVDGGRASD